MRGLISLIIMVLLTGVATAGKVYESSFGFRVLFPGNNWIVLDQAYVRENQHIVESVFVSSDTSPETKAMLTSIKEMILRGEVEYYFSENPSFVIAVDRSLGTVPKSGEELQRLCQSLPLELSERAGKSIKVYECSKKRFNGRDTLVFIADGHNEGSKYIQYQLDTETGNVIIFTATSARVSNFDEMVKLTESLMNSIELRKK
ncbi:MAG: hypothetical protein N2260_00965 [Syntrophobacterales bacterium]|nr:hypothetical protein [Syntrophobacterales bacterium]